MTELKRRQLTVATGLTAITMLLVPVVASQSVGVAHTQAVTSVAFSPDGATFLSGSEDTTAILWDAATGAAIDTFAGHAQGVTSVAFSPDGAQILPARRTQRQFSRTRPQGLQSTPSPGTTRGSLP